MHQLDALADKNDHLRCRQQALEEQLDLDERLMVKRFMYIHIASQNLAATMQIMHIKLHRI